MKNIKYFKGPYVLTLGLNRYFIQNKHRES